MNTEAKIIAKSFDNDDKLNFMGRSNILLSQIIKEDLVKKRKQCHVLKNVRLFDQKT